MKTLTILAAMAALAVPAAAQQLQPHQQQQQQPQQQQNLQQDPAFLQRALGAMQAQRNAALDAQAVLEARIGMLTEELARANSELAKARQPTEQPPAPAKE